MKLLTRSALLAAAAICVAGPAFAAQIPDGTVSYVNLTQPAVNYSVSPSTVAFNGTTFELTGTGGFSAVGGLLGSMLGTLSFSTTVNSTISQVVNNFFSFADGSSGQYIFSLDSVTTTAYTVNPGVSQSFGLYLLGSTVDTNLGYTATPTSLTMTFNQTGNSGFSASGTLAVPPAGSVPEPASWAMMVGGFGLLGATLRRKRTAAVVTFG
ncbi:PEPxxWA-CTERM sorting domain-containing protein [Sphingomonas bacterium]|uniref:PEPxxWA-CTERM sorting domain-containing protein n=1 Tax=Sphingomonas bacterium TaxID=1895847 RepID=UPI0020C70BC7|nr:PEPxxWA-CTERM sorting domain-containing protein [Sphingomonas bacterium]